MPSPITTHVLDTSNGRAASGVALNYQVLNTATQTWETLHQGQTNDDGRCPNLSTSSTIQPGMYRIRFETKKYFEKLNQPCFFPYAEVVFEVSNPPEKHYHVPLLLSNYGYSTYRGTSGVSSMLSPHARI